MQERQVARKVNIKIIYSGDYTVQEGFNPNYIEVNGEKISRVRVLATIIDKFMSEDGNYGTITLDDGTDTIRCKIFQDLRLIEEAEKGDLVDVVGKIREYNEERYIQPEIIAKVENPNLEVLRILEIRKKYPPEQRTAGSSAQESKAPQAPAPIKKVAVEEDLAEVETKTTPAEEPEETEIDVDAKPEEESELAEEIETDADEARAEDAGETEEAAKETENEDITEDGVLIEEDFEIVPASAKKEAAKAPVTQKAGGKKEAETAPEKKAATAKAAQKKLV
ncbi:MAG: OB-fold nucleic acid binding domain-containing protein [Candidatus Aenigmatarchaeota archaeon]